MDFPPSNPAPKPAGEPPSLVRRWLRRLYVGLRGYFALVGLTITLLPILVMCSLASMGRVGRPAAGEFDPKKPVVLELEIDGAIVAGSGDFAEFLATRLTGQPITMRLPEIQRALRRAAKDDRVSGLEIEINEMRGSPADFTEFRRLVEQFRDAGKPVKILLNEPSDWNYYVGSVANELVINPASTIFAPGPVFRFVYLGEAMRKLGIDFELVRAGKFKSAAEPLIQNDPSPATLEQYRSMEAALRQHWIESVAKGRGKEPAEVESWLKQSLFTASDAITMGIIDGTGYKETEDKEHTLRDFLNATEGSESAEKGAGGIALIEARGEIVLHDSDGGDVIAPLTLRDEIIWARDEDDVKAVVLRIDSPGGSATASDIIWGELNDLVRTKPVIVSMGEVAASGGYYIAAPAQEIFAEPTTITGSIGVFGVMPNFEAFRDKYGVSFHVVTGSDRAALLDPGRKSTAFDKALLESGIDQVYRVFLDRVASGRKLKLEDVEKLAQGRVYTGKEALDLKLVDALGGIQDAFRAAKKRAGFDPDKLYPVLRYEDDFDLSRCLTSPGRMRRCFGGVRAAVLGEFRTPLDELPPSAARLGQLAARARPGEVWALATFLPAHF